MAAHRDRRRAPRAASSRSRTGRPLTKTYWSSSVRCGMRRVARAKPVSAKRRVRLDGQERRSRANPRRAAPRSRARAVARREPSSGAAVARERRSGRPGATARPRRTTSSRGRTRSRSSGTCAAPGALPKRSATSSVVPPAQARRAALAPCRPRPRRRACRRAARGCERSRETERCSAAPRRGSRGRRLVEVLERSRSCWWRGGRAPARVVGARCRCRRRRPDQRCRPLESHADLRRARRRARSRPAPSRRGRPLDDFARGDLVDQDVGKYADGGHYRFSPSAQRA